MARALRAAMHRDPNKVAIQHGTKQRTFAELSQRVDRLTAAAISEFGLRKGDHAAIVAKNCIEYIEIACGIPEAGVAVAAIGSKLAGPEIAAICDDSGARVLFVDDAAADVIDPQQLGSVERVVQIGSEYEAIIEGAKVPDEYPEVFEWDPWVIPYTSGTTGQPKGVLLSHRSRLLGFYQQALEFGCYSPDDRFLGTTPMHHGAGMAFPLAAIMAGGFTELVDKFDPELLLRKLKNEGFSGVFTVPAQHHAIFQLEPRILEQYRSPAIKALISNAAPLPQTLKHQIVDYFGDNVLHETYGSTEAGFVTNLRPPYQLSKERCVGTPFAHTLVKLTDDDFNEVGVDTVGELWTSSTSAFNGYWQRPEETAAAFHDGWITVGDLARRDADGFVYIVDRKKDMVITGGINVYPREIEEILSQHEAVAQVAVVGVDDDQWGERLKAFVVLRGEAALDAADVESFCDGKLARYKIPREVAIIDELPRNAAGKILKTSLREL